MHDTGVLTDGYPKYDADVFTYDGPFEMVEGEGGELVVVKTLSIFPNGDGGKFVPSARGTVTYEGAVIDADGVVGKVTLKMTKPNKKGLFNLTATVKTADKKSYTFKAKKVQAPAEGPLEMSLEGSNKKSKEHKLTVTLEGNSLRGAFDGAQIDGASDAFKDRKSKRAEAIKPFEGTWTGAFADGLVSFSAKLTKAGKAKVKVVLPGGKAASCSAKAEVGDLSDGIIAVPVTVRKSAKDGVTTFGFRLAFDMADGKLVCQVVDISPLTLTDKKTGAVTGSVRMDFSSASRLTMTSKAFKALPVNLPEALTAKLGQPTKVSLKMASTGIISGSLKFGKVGAKASGIVIGDKGIGQLTVKQGQTEEVFGFTVGSVK